MSEKTTPVTTTMTAITSKDYSKDYALALFRHFKERKNATMASFCASLDVSVGKFRKWLERHEELQQVWDIVQTKSLDDYTELGLGLADGTVRGNVAAYKYLTSNLFPEEFKDKQTVEHQGGMVISIDTGIKRPGDDGYENWIEAESTVIEGDDSDLV